MSKNMNKKQKEETVEIFAEAFREVVVPVLEEMKKDFNDLRQDVHHLDDKVEGISRRLIQVTDHHANRLDNHEKRIGKLEVKASN